MVLICLVCDTDSSGVNRGLTTQLLPQETVEWSAPALQSVGATSVGGTLCLTDRRLLFVPNGLNFKRRRVMGEVMSNGQPWSVDRSAISNPEVTRTGDAYNGEMRKRLRIRIAGSDDQLFAVKYVDMARAELGIRLSAG